MSSPAADNNVNPPAQKPGWGAIARALRSRNYRLFFAGQLISLIGTWLTTVATSWLVYRLTHDTLQLGMISFAGQIPAFLLAPLAGVLVDRWNLHRVLVATQTLSMLQSGALAFLTLTGWVTVPWVLGLFLVQGLINAFDMPARQAFLVHLVDRREDLPNAIALNSSMFNAARLLGPSIGGVIIAFFGEGICFALDAVSYIAVIIALLMMRVTLPPRTRVRRHVVAEFGEGFGYVARSRPIRALLLMLAIVSLAGVPYTVLMPVFAQDVLHGDARTLGLLMASSGLGALIGAIWLAARTTVLGLGRVIAAAAGGFGLCLLLFSFSRLVWLSAPLLAAAGFCMISQMASSNTVLQTIVEDEMRGRVMGLYSMSFLGMMPLGSLLAGFLANPHRLGAPTTVALGGAVCILGSAVFSAKLPVLRRHVRPIYVQRGILAEPGEMG